MHLHILTIFLHLLIPYWKKTVVGSIFKNWIDEGNMLNSIKFRIHSKISLIRTKLTSSVPFLPIQPLDPFFKHSNKMINFLLLTEIQKWVLCIPSLFFIFEIKRKHLNYLPSIKHRKITQFPSHFNLFEMSGDRIELDFLFEGQQCCLD